MEWLRYIFHRVYACRRQVAQFLKIDLTPVKNAVAVSTLPWFWIGAQFSDSNTETVTDLINKQVNYGCRITPQFLEETTGYKNVTWRYMDAETLELKDFPSEGIVIDGP